MLYEGGRRQEVATFSLQKSDTGEGDMHGMFRGMQAGNGIVVIEAESRGGVCHFRRAFRN